MYIRSIIYMALDITGITIDPVEHSKQSQENVFWYNSYYIGILCQCMLIYISTVLIYFYIGLSVFLNFLLLTQY